MKITAIIPTLNEEIHIIDAIKSVSFADEIIVIDSFSTDKTVELVKQNIHVKLIQRVFDDFSSQKNHAIAKAKYEWIYILDADERVPLALRNEILEIKKKGTKYVAFKIKRAFYYEKSRVFFSGFQRGSVIRLFNKKTAIYKGLVHERIVISKGELGELKNRLNHYSFKNFEHYKSKLDKYAKLQAQELLKKNVTVNFYHLRIKPVIRFLTHMFIKFGFLDGKKGFVLSYLQAYGVHKRYIELKKLYR